MNVYQISMCLHTLKLRFTQFDKSFGAALANGGPKPTPKEPLTYVF
jgi:hypothetical protein